MFNESALKLYRDFTSLNRLLTQKIRTMALITLLVYPHQSHRFKAWTNDSQILIKLNKIRHALKNKIYSD